MDEAQWVASVIAPAAEDSADVRWACETAAAMWSRGERQQALQWVHHAVQAATSAGKHERADQLDRAAQELEHLPLPRRPGPSAESDPASTTAPTAQDLPLPQKPKLARTAPYKLAPDDITQFEQPSLGLLEACEPSTVGATHSGVGPASIPGAQPVSATNAGVGPERSGAGEGPPKGKPSRPLPPAPTQDPYEATVVNAGIKPKQERTVLLDMRGFSPGATEPEQAPAVTVAAPETAPVPVPLEEIPKRRSSFDPTPASLLGAPLATTRPATDFERTVERRAPVLPDELPTEKTTSDRPASVSGMVASSSGASSAPGTLGSPNSPLESMRARRVAVSSGNGKELSVRLLDEGEDAPDGTQEAILLPLK
jgi:hypothetical protein